MKNCRVIFKPQAEQDLKQLNHYLNQRFGREKAKLIMKSLEVAILNLGKWPNLGRNAAELSPVLSDYQYFRRAKSTIFYQTNVKAELVIIIRIYDNRTDVIAHLLAGL